MRVFADLCSALAEIALKPGRLGRILHRAHAKGFLRIRQPESALDREQMLLRRQLYDLVGLMEAGATDIRNFPQCLQQYARLTSRRIESIAGERL